MPEADGEGRGMEVITVVWSPLERSAGRSAIYKMIDAFSILSAVDDRQRATHLIEGGRRQREPTLRKYGRRDGKEATPHCGFKP